MKKLSFLEEAIYKATIKERERVVNVFSIETRHNGKTHYEGIDCWFCKAVEKVVQENND